jgi:hypothetical protein
MTAARTREGAWITSLSGSSPLCIMSAPTVNSTEAQPKSSSSRVLNRRWKYRPPSQPKNLKGKKKKSKQRERDTRNRWEEIKEQTTCRQCRRRSAPSPRRQHVRWTTQAVGEPATVESKIDQSRAAPSPPPSSPFFLFFLLFFPPCSGQTCGRVPTQPSKGPSEQNPLSISSSKTGSRRTSVSML